MNHLITHADIDDSMDHHPPTDERTVKAHELARRLAKAHAKAILDVLPSGREKALVRTALQEALMWANAAIAINGGPAGHVTVEHLDEIRDGFSVYYGEVPTETPL